MNVGKASEMYAPRLFLLYRTRRYAIINLSSESEGTLMFEWFTEFMESPLGKLDFHGNTGCGGAALTLAAAGLVNRLMKSWLTVTGKRTAVLRPS